MQEYFGSHYWDLVYWDLDVRSRRSMTVLRAQLPLTQCHDVHSDRSSHTFRLRVQAPSFLATALLISVPRKEHSLPGSVLGRPLLHERFTQQGTTSRCASGSGTLARGYDHVTSFLTATDSVDY